MHLRVANYGESGEGHDAKAPVQKVPVEELEPHQILVKVSIWESVRLDLSYINIDQLDRSVCFRQELAPR